jgi:RNA polymerase subunit RPABC4/transcription elongation factor Spt4
LLISTMKLVNTLGKELLAIVLGVGVNMECGSCSDLIPDDSIFCPECGSRQDLSRAGGFTSPNSIGLSGQEVSGGRNFGVVSGDAIRQQREMSMNEVNSISPELLQQIAQGLQNQQNIPPGNFPAQNLQGNPINMQNQNLGSNLPPNLQNLGSNNRGNVIPNNDINNQNNQNVAPTNSPTDQMVNRIAEAERAIKTERRSQWLNMNQSPASNVLSSLGADLPSHLRGNENPAQSILTGALGTQTEAPNEAFLRRMCEVAVRRVARKRGVAVETPQAKLNQEILSVNITYVDDGRVLDTPDDLKHAFEHAIQTEVALKGFEYVVDINLFRSKDGDVESLSDDSSGDGDEEMFACEICEGLVKESDNACPHCGAIFEDDEEDEISQPARNPPRSPGRSSPPGPSGGQPSPSRGPPGGPKRSGPSGPSGPSGSPNRGGPPGGAKKGGPPGGAKKGGPPGGAKNSGPPGGPKKGGPPGGPKKGGPPGGPKKGGPPGGPKRGPPGGPKRGPPR